MEFINTTFIKNKLETKKAIEGLLKERPSMASW
jgi:hypothetical protein